MKDTGEISWRGQEGRPQGPGMPHKEEGLAPEGTTEPMKRFKAEMTRATLYFRKFSHAFFILLDPVYSLCTPVCSLPESKDHV